MVEVTVRFASYLQETIGVSEEGWRMPTGSDVYELLDELITYYGKQLEEIIYDEDGKQRPTLRIILNGWDIRFLSDEKLVLGNGDIVLILPGLAGG
ncbi:MAG: MoaD family protein [Tissierellia bacterium]|nr:MoaD family protein [Tissierellia bacterium]